MKKLEIFCDGSSRGNPGPGGFGLVVLDENRVIYRVNRAAAHTTNNREELKGILEALAYATEHPDVSFTIYSDSAYCVNICNNWIWTWSQNNWLNSKKKLIENDDLVKDIYGYLASEDSDWNIQNFKIVKTDGHAGIAGNELADALATSSFERYEKLLVEYNILDEIGED